jgi:hypothetical protein
VGSLSAVSFRSVVESAVVLGVVSGLLVVLDELLESVGSTERRHPATPANPMVANSARLRILNFVTF